MGGVYFSDERPADDHMYKTHVLAEMESSYGRWPAQDGTTICDDMCGSCTRSVFSYDAANLQNLSQQESIQVGCVPPARLPEVGFLHGTTLFYGTPFMEPPS